MPSKRSNKDKSVAGNKAPARTTVAKPAVNSSKEASNNKSVPVKQSAPKKVPTPPVPANKKPTAPRKPPVAKLPKSKLDEIKLDLNKSPEINQLPKPKFKRVRFWENGIEMYLQEGRKVTIFQQDDGTFVIGTKKSLDKDEDFTDFMPVSIDLDTKWGMRVASCRFVLSREAILAIGMGLNELVKSQVIK